jgi:hypothetical protein
VAAVVRHVDAREPPHALAEVIFRLRVVDGPPRAPEPAGETSEAAAAAPARIDHSRHVEFGFGRCNGGRGNGRTPCTGLELCQMQDTGGDREPRGGLQGEPRGGRPPGKTVAELVHFMGPFVTGAL